MYQLFLVLNQKNLITILCNSFYYYLLSKIFYLLNEPNFYYIIQTKKIMKFFLKIEKSQ